jgi:FixJ family two-component response regulator
MVFVLDDDAVFRESMQRALTAAGHRIAFYTDGRRFLADCDQQQAGCVVLETRLHGVSGLEVQSELKRRAIDWPLVFVTAHGNIASAVAAVRNGAAEFFEKPIAESVLMAAIEKALKLDALRRREHARKRMVAATLEKLTSRERQIMRFVVAGKMNKTIADELCISIKTVEAHRARVMQKVGVDSLAALVQLALQLDPAPRQG